ncbi:acyltransferase family protein [Mucilaginibacter paludis]
MSYHTRFNFHAFANLGVQFFFVISGFLITTLLLKEQVKKGNISLKNFYIRRFFRIIPIAYLYLVCVVALNFILHLKLNPLYILASFLFIRNFFWGSTKLDHLTTHYWSLSVEEQFYLFFPVILKKNINVYICFLLFLIAFGVILDFNGEFLKSLDSTGATYLIISFLNQFQGIAIGSLFCILIVKGKISSDFKQKTFKMVCLLFLILLLTFFSEGFGNVKNILKCFAFAYVVFMCLEVDNSIFYRFLNHAWVKLIGVLSFSIYIWQQPLTLGLNFFNSSGLIQRFSNKLPVDLAFSLISIIVLFCISYISYHYYEKKFLKLRERYRD